jgi:uncharacterized protein YdhG (YjbR/CyaY superfamily)
MSAAEIDEYLRGVDEPKRGTLQALRRTILEIVPDAEQGISYRVPAFRMQGKVVAGFAAFKDHRPLPKKIVQRLIAVRLAELRECSHESRETSVPVTGAGPARSEDKSADEVADGHRPETDRKRSHQGVREVRPAGARSDD